MALTMPVLLLGLALLLAIASYLPPLPGHYLLATATVLVIAAVLAGGA